MISVSNSVLTLFFASSLVVFLFRFIKDKEIERLDFKQIGGCLKVLAAVTIPFVAILLLAKVPDMQVASSWIYFFAGAAVPYILSQIGLNAWLRAILLLAIAVGGSLALPADSYAFPLIGALTGLSVWKTAENLLKKPGCELEDFIPSFLWLTGIYWIKTSSGAAHPEIQYGLLLGTLAVGILLRWVQMPLLPDDKVYLKRIVLATTGGLAVLIVINKLLLGTSIMTIASLAGAGFFLTYLFEAMDKPCDRPADEPPSAVKALKSLIFIGIFTLLATRLFGMEGLLVLAATTIVGSKPGTARVAAIFWGARVLLQAFVFQFNANVTGINLMHPYTSAALYAGFILVAVTSIFIRDVKDTRILTAIFLIVGSVAAPASNFFIHEEPTGALIVAASVAAVLLSVLASSLYKETIEEHSTLMLLPVQMISFAILTNELIAKGNEATVHDKLVAMAILGGIGILAAIVNHVVISGGPGKTSLPSSGETTGS